MGLMPGYTVPHGQYPGGEPPKPLPSVVRLDEPLGAGYLQTIGIYSQDAVAIGQYQLAGGQTTQMGGYLTYQVAVISPQNGVSYQQVTLVDVAGSGPGSIQYVDQPTGGFAPIHQAPSLDAPKISPANKQDGGDGTGTDSTQTTTQGQTVTTSGVDSNGNPTSTTTYTPDPGAPDISNQPTLQQGGGYTAPPDASS